MDVEVEARLVAVFERVVGVLGPKVRREIVSRISRLQILLMADPSLSEKTSSAIRGIARGNAELIDGAVDAIIEICSKEFSQVFLEVVKVSMEKAGQVEKN